MRYLFFTFLLLLSLLPALSVSAMERIALVVNDVAITEHDIEARMKMVMGSAGLPNTPEVRARVVPQIVKSLIEEQLKLQEAARLDIKVDEADIEKGFAQVAQNNKMEPDEFEALLKKAGVDVRSVTRQIEAEIAWAQVVQKTLKPQVFVSDSDIDDARQRVIDAQGKSEYLIAEIFLPVNAPSDEADVNKTITGLATEVQRDSGAFYKLAQQFSKAAGAAQGGNVGWVQEGQLDDALDDALSSLEKGQVSDPVRSSDGYHLLFLRDKRIVDAQNLPSDAQIQYDIGIERLQRLERRYLMDLRASAFIEQRV